MYMRIETGALKNRLSGGELRHAVSPIAEEVLQHFRGALAPGTKTMALVEVHGLCGLPDSREIRVQHLRISVD
jgi:hypothetical protein